MAEDPDKIWREEQEEAETKRARRGRGGRGRGARGRGRGGTSGVEAEAPGLVAGKPRAPDRIEDGTQVEDLDEPVGEEAASKAGPLKRKKSGLRRLKSRRRRILATSSAHAAGGERAAAHANEDMDKEASEQEEKAANEKDSKAEVEKNKQEEAKACVFRLLLAISSDCFRKCLLRKPDKPVIVRVGRLVTPGFV